MKLMNCGIQAGTFLTTLLCCTFALPVSADGVCEYHLHGARTKNTFQVCEVPVGDNECGTFLTLPDGSKSQNAYPASKMVVTKSCSVDNIVGVCSLPTAKLAFYEGDPMELELGCVMMKGEWQVFTLAEKRDATFLKDPG